MPSSPACRGGDGTPGGACVCGGGSADCESRWRGSRPSWQHPEWIHRHHRHPQGLRLSLPLRLAGVRAVALEGLKIRPSPQWEECGCSLANHQRVNVHFTVVKFVWILLGLAGDANAQMSRLCSERLPAQGLFG